MLSNLCDKQPAIHRARIGTGYWCGACLAWYYNHDSDDPANRTGLHLVKDEVCTVVENGKRCTNKATRRHDADLWCVKHHTRYKRHGDPLIVKAERRPHGEVQEILRRAAFSTATACIFEPSPSGGRLSVSYQGKPMTASRAVWMIAHDGEDPGEDFILHTCHRGDEGCININCLETGDHTINMEQMLEAGRSNRGERNGQAELTVTDVRQIRVLADSGMSQLSIAKRYGIDPSHVSDIKRRKRWGWLD